MRSYRLAIYDPDPTAKKIHRTGRIFHDTPYDREVMLVAIRRYNELSGDDPESMLCLAAFPVKPARKRKALS